MIWKQGGLYIINCGFTGYITDVTENHAFLYNADYTGPDNICHGSIVDNQKHTHLFGIEKSDVSTKAKVRKNFNNLFSGITRFTHCFKVTKKQGEASAFLTVTLKEEETKLHEKSLKKGRKKYRETINFG